MSYIFFLFLAGAFCASHIKASSTAELGKVNTTETAVLAETAKVGCVVIFLSFVLLILIDPLPDTILAQIQPTKSLGKEGGTNLVKISLDEMHLLSLLQQTRPVLQSKLLLSENHLDATRAVVYFTVVDVDFGIEIQGHAILVAFQVCAGERNIVLCEFDVCRFGRHIRDVDEEVEVVAGFVGFGGALSPGDYNIRCVSGIERKDRSKSWRFS